MHLFANVHLTKFDMHIFWLANIFISWLYVLWFVFFLTCLCFTLWWIERMFSLHPESSLVLFISLSNNKSELLYMYNNTCIEIQLLGFKNNISLRQVGINAHGIQSSSWTKIQCFQNNTQRQVAPPAQFQLEWQTLTSIYATMVSWTYLSRCKTKQHFDIVCWATVAVLDPLLGPAQQNLFTNASVTNTNWANKKNKSHKRCKIQLSTNKHKQPFSHWWRTASIIC